MGSKEESFWEKDSPEQEKELLEAIERYNQNIADLRKTLHQRMKMEEERADQLLELTEELSKPFGVFRKIEKLIKKSEDEKEQE